MATQLETRPTVTAPPPPPVAPLVETLIAPPRGWQWLNLRELWQFRELVFFLAWRDVKVRYKQTVLGAAWAILQPAMMMVVFTILFHKIGGVGADGSDYPYPEHVPYYLIAFLGLLPWTFFANAITTAGQSVLGSERLITKIYFPRLALPFAAVAAALVDSLIASALLVVMMAWQQVTPTWNLLLLPVIYVLIIVAALGVGALLAGLQVAYRDFRYVTPFMIQLWMFATTAVYSVPRKTGSGGWLDTVLTLNPLTGLVEAFRAACLGGPIGWTQLAYSAACVAVLFFVGCVYFRKVEDWFADII
jgi:lipopolysaccharide transport system permease protein